MVCIDVLENGADDFENSEEVYEAVGEVLQEISCDKSEAEIRLEFNFLYTGIVTRECV